MTLSDGKIDWKIDDIYKKYMHIKLCQFCMSNNNNNKCDICIDDGKDQFKFAIVLEP